MTAQSNGSAGKETPTSALQDEPHSPYAKWSETLTQTPLFRGLSADEVTCLLSAMAPRVVIGRPSPGQEGDSAFRLVVECDPPHEVAPGRFEFSMPEDFTPGMLLAEVGALSGFRDFRARLPEHARPPLGELKWEITTLEFTVGMLGRDYGGKVSHLQTVMLVNLSRMMAQKVVDARRSLMLEKHGVDVFA